MTNSEPIHKGHNILLCLKDSENEEVLWKWTIENITAVGKYSERLEQCLGKTAFTRIDCNDKDEAEALATIIQEIPGNGKRIAGLRIDPPDYGFSRLLRLAASLFEYKCSIPPNFHEYARIVLGLYHPRRPSESQTLPHASPLHWMFIAFVFGWVADFEEVSVEVITKNDPSKSNEELAFLPTEFRDLITQKRKENVHKTWMYIIRCCLILGLTGNIKKIADDFRKMGLDLLDVEGKNPMLYAMNAHHLLAILEYSVQSKDKDLETITPPSRTTEKAGAIDGHGTGFGAMFRSMIHDNMEKISREKLKRMEEQTPRGSTSSSEQSEWKTIELGTSVWRDVNLETALSLDAEFGQLRDKHVQEGYPEGQKVVPIRDMNTANVQPRRPVASPFFKASRKNARLEKDMAATVSSSGSEFGVGGSNPSQPPTLYEQRASITDWLSTGKQAERLGTQASFSDQSYRSRYK